MRRLRKLVEVSPRVVRPHRGGQQVRLWAYGYADLAELFGTSEGAVRRAVARRRFDPGNLRSIFAYAGPS